MSEIKNPTSKIPSKEEYLSSRTPEQHLNDFFQMHMPLIHGIVGNWHKNNAKGIHDESGNPIDVEDLHLPAYDAFHEAIAKYNPQKSSDPSKKPMSWNNYLNQQIKYKLQNHIQNITAYKGWQKASAKVGKQDE